MAEAHARFNSVREWQDALEVAFRDSFASAIDRNNLLEALELRQQESLIRRCYGFKVLMDCLQAHALDTFHACCTIAPAPGVLDYALRVAAFRRLRCSLNTFWRGYPGEATADVRSLWEALFFIGAVCNGYADSNEFVPSSQQIARDQAEGRSLSQIQKAQRDRTRDRVHRQMCGSTSGLSEADQTEIESTLGFFHVHVHRCEWSVLDICQKTQDTHIWASAIAEPTDDDIGAYTNLSVVAAWGFARVLPFLPSPDKFGPEWRRRRDALENGFAYYLDSMCRAERICFAPAFRRLIDQKFSF